MSDFNHETHRLYVADESPHERRAESIRSKQQDADDWTPIIRYRCLHRYCMVVAKTRVEGKWKAYCGPVAGMNHDREAVDEERGPLNDGDDVGEKIARILFPEFDELPYAR